jgi:hypothetical protein
MIKHIHKLARYTALILISASPMPFDDAYAETSEQQIAAAELALDKTPANHKPKSSNSD